MSDIEKFKEIMSLLSIKLTDEQAEEILDATDRFMSTVNFMSIDGYESLMNSDDCKLEEIAEEFGCTLDDIKGYRELIKFGREINEG